MTAHEKLEIMDLNSEILGNILFRNNQYQSTYARFVLLYVANVEIAGFNFSYEKSNIVQSRHVWYKWH